MLRVIADMCISFQGQMASILASQIYRENDKPLYRAGNAALIAICVYNVLLFVGIKMYYVRINK